MKISINKKKLNFIKYLFKLVNIFQKKNKLARIMYKVAYYVELAGELANKPRKNGGNMFRHQMITFTILIQYCYYDLVLLKASIIHDLFEDFPERIEEFEKEILKNDPIDGADVVSLVHEVSILTHETKEEFYVRIFTKQSRRAQILKIVDNISNMTHLAHHGDELFTIRYIRIIEEITLLYSDKIDKALNDELEQLIELKKERMLCWLEKRKK